MDILLEIDYREREIIELLELLKVSGTIKLNYSVNNLHIGDFVFRDPEDPGNSIFYIIERKSIQDLCSSITDGRFREQKARLLDSTNDSSKIVYILEGNVKSGNLPQNTIDSAIMNLSFKHNYKVIFSESTQDTLTKLLLLYKKITENTDEFSKTLLNPIKKADKVNIFTSQLCIIGGVSLNIANKINEKYDSMVNLIDAFKESDALLLSDITITDKRKLGKALSTKIYNGIFGVKEQIKIMESKSKPKTSNPKPSKPKSKPESKSKEVCNLDVGEVRYLDGGPGTYPEDDCFL